MCNSTFFHFSLIVFSIELSLYMSFLLMSQVVLCDEKSQHFHFLYQVIYLPRKLRQLYCSFMDFCFFFASNLRSYHKEPGYTGDKLYSVQRVWKEQRHSPRHSKRGIEAQQNSCREFMVWSFTGFSQEPYVKFFRTVILNNTCEKLPLEYENHLVNFISQSLRRQSKHLVAIPCQWLKVNYRNTRTRYGIVPLQLTLNIFHTFLLLTLNVLVWYEQVF